MSLRSLADGDLPEAENRQLIFKVLAKKKSFYVMGKNEGRRNEWFSAIDSQTQ
jgi:hypothetical protein